MENERKRNIESERGWQSKGVASAGLVGLSGGGKCNMVSYVEDESVGKWCDAGLGV